MKKPIIIALLCYVLTNLTSFSQGQWIEEEIDPDTGLRTGKIEINAKNLKLDTKGGTLDLVGNEVAFNKNADLEATGFDDVRVEAQKIGLGFKSSLNIISTRKEIPTDITFKTDHFSVNRGFIGNVSKKRGVSTGEVRITGFNGPAGRVEVSDQSRILIMNKGDQA